MNVACNFTTGYDEAQRKREIAASEKAMTEFAIRWNDHNAGTKGLEGELRKQALLKYAKRVRNSERICEKEPRLWASVILSRIADGEILPAICKRLAESALNIVEVEI